MKTYKPIKRELQKQSIAKFARINVLMASFGFFAILIYLVK